MINVIGRKKRIILVIMLLITTATSGCALWDREPVEEAEKDPVPVVVHKATEGTLIDYARFHGQVTTQGEIPVVPMTSGIIEKVHVQVGDQVEKEDLLVQLDDAKIQEAIDEAEKTVQESEDRLADIEGEWEEIFDSENGLDLIGQQASDLGRLISEMQLEAARLMQAQQILSELKTQQEYFSIKAPAAGTVAAVSVTTGGLAAPGNPVVVLVDTRELLVSMHVFENQINRIEIDQEVKVAVRAFSELPLYGRVASISPAMDPRTRAYEVRVHLHNREKAADFFEAGLRIGMFARIEVPLKEYEQVLMVFREAVLKRPEGTVVFVVVGDRAYVRQVETGFHSNEYVKIKSGLKVDDPVVVSGQQYLMDKDPVLIRRWGEER